MPPHIKLHIHLLMRFQVVPHNVSMEVTCFRHFLHVWFTMRLTDEHPKTGHRRFGGLNGWAHSRRREEHVTFLTPKYFAFGPPTLAGNVGVSLIWFLKVCDFSFNGHQVSGVTGIWLISFLGLSWGRRKRQDGHAHTRRRQHVPGLVASTCWYFAP